MNSFKRTMQTIVGMLACTFAFSAQAQPTGTAPAEIVRTSCTPPEMPEAAARAGAHGTTVLLLHVDAAGKATQVDVARSSGTSREHKMLDKAAAAAFLRCSFKAAVDENGLSVESTVTLSWTWAFE